MRMMLQRLLRVVPLALMFASVASAQTTGNIIGVVTDAQSGKPIVGALVVATSPLSQGEQTAITDKTGSFRFQLLPPGDYKLATSFDGYKPAERSDLNVRVDKTIRANLSMVPEAVQMEEQVVKTGVSPVINVGSAETGTTISREFTTNIPGTRNFEAIAVVAPGATYDRYGVSFAGATSPENGYILDGMNVTDPSYGTNSLNLNTNFLQEIDVKTGSFMAEYGRATGGIINVVTKSGSNEFHGSVFANYTPGQLEGTPKDVVRAGEAIALRNTPHDGSYRADFGFEVGGPIMKDRLWFYAGFAPQLSTTKQERYMLRATEDPSKPGQPISPIGTEIAGYGRTFSGDATAYQLVAKLTYLFNENNNLAVSYITVPSTAASLTTSSTTGANFAPSANWIDRQSDTSDLVAKFSSKLLDKKLIVEVLGGWHHAYSANLPTTIDGVDQLNTAGVQWRNTMPLAQLDGSAPSDTDPSSPCYVTGTFNPCGVLNYVTGGYGFSDKTTIERLAGKLSATYFASFYGSHQLKAGIDLERSSYEHWKTYTGGTFMRQRTQTAANTAYPKGPYFQDYRRYGAVSADFQSYLGPPSSTLTTINTSNAFYAQDSWSPSALDGLTVNAGIRWETQSMGLPDLPGSQSLAINDNFGPRLQAVYDWTGQGRSKVAASWGRFFEQIPLDMGDRAFGDERQANSYREYCAAASATGVNKGNLAGKPETCAVLAGFYSTPAQIASGLIKTYTPTGTGSTPVNPGLKGQYVDQWNAEVEYEVIADLSVGISYQGRALGRVIEDMSNDDGNNYAIANPGEGKPWDLYGDGSTIFDPQNATAIDPVTGRTVNTKFPKPVRKYDGVTLSAKKNFSNNWQAQVSYTYSSLRGNYGGLFLNENNQLDPNITSDYDLALLLGNKEGPLGGDSPHQFKIYGSYTYDITTGMQLTGGAGLRSQSGTPINYLGAHPVYGNSVSFILPRGSGGRTPFVTNVDLKGAFAYTIKPPYAMKFSVDVFNVLNSQEAVRVDQSWTFNDVQPINNGQCTNRNGATAANAITGGLADCASLQYLKTYDGTAATINKNWGRPSAYQLPLSVRFGLEFTF